MEDGSGPVIHLLQTFLPGKTFAPIVTRDFRPPKPDPAGILHIAREWGLEDRGEGLIMVLPSALALCLLLGGRGGRKLLFTVGLGWRLD